MDLFSVPGLWPFPVLLALVFGFSNGFRDSSTIVATVVSTGLLAPAVAFGLCAVFEFLGAFLIGHAITSTMTAAVSGGIALSRAQVAPVLTAALVSALLWGTLCWWRAWPTSSSQAIVGGITGANFILQDGVHSMSPLIGRMFLILILSPVLGCLISTVVTFILRKGGEWMTPRVRPLAGAFHVLGCVTVSAAHGCNDGQMVAALASLALAGAGTAAVAHAPTPVRLSVAAALTAGVLFGGQRLVHRMGVKFYRIREMQGLGAQMASAVTILTCAASGFPASTTQVVSGSIVGGGVAKNPSSVRWLVVREIVASWIITIPATALLSAGLAMAMRGGRGL